MLAPVYDDLLSPEVNRDPYGYYGRLRVEDPVHWDEKYAVWLVTRYDDTVFVARHPELFSSEYLSRDPRPPFPPIPESDRPYHEYVKSIRAHDLLENDPPKHERLRDAIHPPFAPKQAERWRSMVQSVINQLLDRIAGRGSMDLMGDFATPLPLAIIAELLGIPPQDRPRLRELAHKRMSFARLGADRARLSAEANRELRDYLNPLLDQRKTQPLDDLLSVVSGAEREGVYSREESLANAMVLINAGHETTINLICNGTLAFLQNPDQWALLRQDPALAAKATEECLRYDPPIKTVQRIAAQDVELRGKLVRKDDRVRTVISSANRDPDVFAHPDAFEIARRPNHHVSFGSGIHYCLGQYLARLEGQEVFKALAERFPNLRLASAEIQYIPSLIFRSVQSLEVSWN